MEGIVWAQRQTCTSGNDVKMQNIICKRRTPEAGRTSERGLGMFSLPVLRRNRPTKNLMVDFQVLELWARAPAVLNHLVCGTLSLQPLGTSKCALWLFVKFGPWQALEDHGREWSREGRASVPVLSWQRPWGQLHSSLGCPLHAIIPPGFWKPLLLLVSSGPGYEGLRDMHHLLLLQLHLSTPLKTRLYALLGKNLLGGWHIFLCRTLTNVAPLLPKSTDYHLLVLLLGRVHAIALTTLCRTKICLSKSIYKGSSLNPLILYCEDSILHRLWHNIKPQNILIEWMHGWVFILKVFA